MTQPVLKICKGIFFRDTLNGGIQVFRYKIINLKSCQDNHRLRMKKVYTDI